MDIFIRDIRYSIRMLLKKPGFTLIAFFMLAVGIGANTAIFTVVNAVLLRPLPYPASERVMEVGRAFPGNPFGSNVSEPKFVFLRDHNQSFEAVTARSEERRVGKGGGAAWSGCRRNHDSDRGTIH